VFVAVQVMSDGKGLAAHMFLLCSRRCRTIDPGLDGIVIVDLSNVVIESGGNKMAS